MSLINHFRCDGCGETAETPHHPAFRPLPEGWTSRPHAEQERGGLMESTLHACKLSCQSRADEKRPYPAPPWTPEITK